MGEFDFTYVLPKNFSRRVVQYLEQLESPNVAKAFQNCTYDYEDLGLAYYVGMKGDNWDKKALDSPRHRIAKIERTYTKRIYQQIPQVL